MDNQHKLIKGFRDLTQEEINAMNTIKELAAKVGEMLIRLEENQNPEHTIDKRWLAIAKTDLQTGFMSLVRSIAQPTSF